MIPVRKLCRMPRETALRRAARQVEAMERSLPADSVQRLYMQELASWISEQQPELDTRRLIALLRTAQRSAESKTENELQFELSSLRHALLRRLGMEPAEWDLLPPLGCDRSFTEASPLADIRLYLDGIRSPFNLGSIIRTAAAMGISELLLSPETVSPQHPRTCRSAMGADLQTRYMGYQELLDSGVSLIALETGGEPIDRCLPDPDGILMVGNEELGLHPQLLSAADQRVTIPLWGTKASLNVGVAAGAALYALGLSLSSRNG